MSAAPQRALRRRKGMKRYAGYAVVVVLVIFITLATILEAILESLGRRGNKKSASSQDSARSRLRRLPARYLVATAAAVLVVGGGIAGVSVWYAAMSDSNGLYDIVSTSLDYPAESSLASDEYTVAADMPRLISMPSIGAEGIIQRVTDDQHGFIASPNNVRAAGWYIDSAKPGQPGLSIINGHIEGKYSKGVFYDLSKLKKGDTFSVEYGDGSVKNFVVMTVETISIRDVKAAVKERLPEAVSQLTLVSTTSAFNQGTEAYNQRVIVMAAAR